MEKITAKAKLCLDIFYLCEVSMDERNSNIRFLSAISYVGVLFLIGHFAVERDNPDLRFHKFQGGVLFLSFCIMYALNTILYFLLSFAPPLQTILCTLVYLGLTVAYVILMIMGINSAVRFQQRLLPFVGALAVSLRNKADERRR